MTTHFESEHRSLSGLGRAENIFSSCATYPAMCVTLHKALCDEHSLWDRVLQHFGSCDDHCSDKAESNMLRHSSWIRVSPYFESGDARCLDMSLTLLKQ